MWRNSRIGVRSIALLVGCIGVGSSAIAAPLNNWQFDPTTNQLEIFLEASVVPSYYLETNPPRITIDLPNTELGAVPTQQNYPGAIRRIFLSESRASDTTQIAIELSPEIALSPQHIQLQKFEAASGTNRWVLRPSIVQTVATPAPTPSRRTLLQPAPPRTSPSPSPSVSSPGTRTPQIQFGQPLPKSL